MKHKLNRLTALLLAVIMAFSMLLVPVEATSFADVSAKAWYKSAVDFVSEKGLMAGVSETRFGPETNMTRAMFVTVLARYAGVTVKNDTTVFSDVRKDKWYTGAVTWAAQQGLVSGVGDGRFAPNAEITRQDLCTILCKFLSMEDVVLKRGEGKTFTDANKIASYAKEAVAFCAQTGLIAGFEDGSFGSKKTATRAQVAAILKKLWTLTGGPVLRPAQTLREGDAGMSVTVDAPRGALPEDTDLTVTRVTDEATLAELAKKANGKLIAAADITFSKSGAELEPKTEVEVQIALDGLEDVKNPTVCHVRADGTLEYVSSEQVSLNRSAGSKALRFFAKDFSVYAVLDTPTNPTVTVKFYDRDGRTLLNQQIISVKRLENAVPDDLIVYDPGISSVSESEEFDGWAATSDATEGKTIETINDDLVNLFKGTDSKQYEFSYYPVLHTVARLRYLDQTGEVLDAEVHRFPTGSVQVDVSRLYTPLASNQFFTNVWVEKTAATTFGEGQNSVPSNYGTGARYDVGDKITLNAGQTVDLIPMLQTGGFVFFDMNIAAENERNVIVGSEDTPARYLAPVFAESGGTVTLPTANDSTEANRPYREGYTFGGWYTTSNTRSGSPVSTVTISDTNPTNVTVYAKWEPASVTYYIIHEHQSLSDVVDLDDSQKKFEYYGVEKKTADTGSWISLDSADLKDADGYFFIYNANRSTSGSVQVRGDGSTILHARYDRRVITAYIVDREYLENTNNYDPVDSAALSVNDLYRWSDKIGNQVGDRSDDGFVYLHVDGGYPDDYSTPVIEDGKVTYNETVSSGEVEVEFMKEPFKTETVPVDNVKKLKIPATDNQYFITHRGLYGQSFELGNVLPNEGSPDYERLFHWVHSKHGYGLMFNDHLDEHSPFQYDTELSAVEPDRSTIFYIVRKHIATTDYHVYSHVMDEEGNYQIGYVTVNGKSKQAWVNPDDMTVPYKHQLVQQLRNKPFTLTHVVPGTYAYYLTENTRYSTASSLLQTQPDGTIVLQIAPSTQNQEGYVEYNVMDNIHFWWERDQYDIDYVENGGSSVPTVRDYYEADVSDAGDPVPTREDYLFLGWYADESLTVPWEDYAEKIDNKMPIDGFALYAKWAPLQYRVHLNYFHSDDADSAEEVRFAARSFQTTWLLRTGEKIPIPDNRLATRPGYVFDGWYYKDSAGNEKPFSDDTVVSRGLADEDYGQKKTGESDDAFQFRMRVYGVRTGVDQVTGVPYDDRWNNNNPEREAIVGRIELYARWRKVTYEGLGIQVRYLPNASDGVSGSFASDTPTETDGTHLEKEKYNDGDKAFGYPASTANRADMHFLYWELMDSEGNRTGTKVYPGATFDIDIEDAMRERTYEPGYEPNYTEELRHTHTLTAVAANAVATCSQPAHEAGWYCAGCDTYFTDDQGENIMTVTGGEHNWVKISQTGYCTEAGTSTMRCSYCGREKVVARAAGSHTLSYEDVLPTCTEEGYTGGSHCTVPGCGYSVASTVVPALGHNWVLDQTTTAPTCTQTGLGSAHCDRCGETIQNSVIPARGHLYDGTKTYTWEISADNGSNWIPVSGTPVIEFGNLSNYQLRCTASTTCTRSNCDHGANYVMTQQVTVSTCTHASDPEYGTDVTGTYSASFDAPFAGPQTQNVTLHVSKRVVTCLYPNGGSLTRLGDLGPSDTVTLPNKSDLPADAQTIGNYEVIGWIVGSYDNTTAPSSYFALGEQVHFDDNTTVYALYEGTFGSVSYELATSNPSTTDVCVISSIKTAGGYMLKSNGSGNRVGTAAMELDGNGKLINVPDACLFTFPQLNQYYLYVRDKDGNYLTDSMSMGSQTNTYMFTYTGTSGEFYVQQRTNNQKSMWFNSSTSAFEFHDVRNGQHYEMIIWKKVGSVSYKYKTAPGNGLSAVSDELASARTIDLPETSASVLRDHSASQTFMSRTAPATKEADGKAEPANAAPAEAAAQTNTATPKVNVTPKGTGEQTGHKLTVLYRYRNDENELVPFQYKDYGEAARGLEFYYEADANYCLLNPEFLGYTAETKLTQGKMPDSDLTVTVVYTRNQIEAPANEKWVLETGSTLDPNEEYLIVAVSKDHYGTVGMLQAKQTGSNLVGAAPNFRHVLLSEDVDVTPGWMALPQPLGYTLTRSGWTAMNNPDDYSDSFYIDSAYEFGELFDHYAWENGSLRAYYSGDGWTDKTVDLKSCIWKVRQIGGGGYVIDSASDPNYHLTWDDSGVFPSNTDSDIWYYDSTNRSLKTQFTSESVTREIYLSIEYPLAKGPLNSFAADQNFTVQHLPEYGWDVKYDKHPYAFIQLDPVNVNALWSKVFFFKRESAEEHTVVLRDDKGVAFTSFTVPDGGVLSNYMPSTVAPEGYTVKSWTEADGTEYEVSSGNGAMMSQAVPTRGGFQTNGFDSVTVTKNMDFTAEYEPHFTQTYEIQLRATYGPYSEDGKTHIYWYANNGTVKNNGGGARVMDTAVVPYESAVQIPVPSAATTPESVPGMSTENRVFYEGISGRDPSDAETGVVGEAEVGLNYPGHIFLGWVKFDEENNEIGEAHEELRTLNPNNPEDMAKLALIWDGEKYTYNPDIMVPKGYVGGTSGDGPDAAVNPTRGPVASGTENVTATVKADSTFPYQKFVAAYAVVEVDYFYIFHSATGVLERRELNYQDVDDGNCGTVRKATPVDLTTAVAPGHRYGGYYHTYGGVNTNKIDEVVANPYATWETSGLSTSASGLIALIDALERMGDNLTQADAEKIVEELSTNKTLILISKLLEAEWPNERLQHFPKEDLIEAVTNPNGAFYDVGVDALLQSLAENAQWTEERRTNFLSKFPANELIADITGTHKNASGVDVPNLDDEKVNALIELLDDADKLTVIQKTNVLSMFRTEVIDSLTEAEKNALIRSIDNTVDPTAWTEDQKNSFLDTHNVTGAMLHAVLTPAREKTVIEAVVNPSGWNGPGRNAQVIDFLGLFTPDELADRLIKVLPDEEADHMIERLVENTRLGTEDKQELLDSFTGSELADALGRTLQDFTAIERFADLEASSSYWTNDKMEQILSTFCGASVVNALLTTDGEQAVVTIDELKLIFDTVGYPDGYTSENIGEAAISEITGKLSALTTEEIQKLDALTNQGVTGILETDGVEGFGFEPYEGEKSFTQDGTNKNFWTKSQAYNVANATTEIPAADINGQTMRPVKDTVYYLKEVPEVYLSSKFYFTYKNGETGDLSTATIRAISMVTLVDDTYYKQYGFNVDNLTDPEEGYVTYKGIASKKFVISKTGDGTQTQSINVTAATFGAPAGYVVPVQWKKETMGEDFNAVPMWTTLDGVDVVATENERHIDINNPLDCLSKRMKLDLETATVDGQSWLADGFQTKVCIYDGNGTDARWLDVNVNNRIMIPDLGAHYKKIQIVRYADANAAFFKGNNGDLTKADAYTEIFDINYSVDEITSIEGSKPNNG